MKTSIKKSLQTVTLPILLLLTSSLSLAAINMPGMAEMDMSVGSEFDFLAGMVPHHQDALESAELAVERAERPKVRELAQEIITAQEAEISQMETWLAEWYPEGDREGAEAMMDESMAMTGETDLRSLSGAAFDRAFLEEMVMHHTMAVEMVDSLLEQDLVEHDEVRVLAEEIRSAQKAEIRRMQGWLRDLYGVSEHEGH
jgi:uncharacterized protein (DUF305 family)